MNKKVGMVGIGLLGKSVATRFLELGYKLTVYNRTKEKVIPLTNLGATVVENPKDVAKDCNLVITILNDAKSVEEVAFGDNGLVKENHDGLVVADMTTIDPVASKSIGDKFKEYGITKLDIPVMGGPPLALKGELLMMVGGEKDTYKKLKKVFGAIASQIFYIGENGTSNAIKLAMNLQIAMLALALSEGITLTRGAGLNPEVFLRILNSTYFKTGMSKNKAYKMIKANYEPTFYLKLMKKDLDTINAASNQFNLQLPMAILANKLYQNATDSGFGELDYTGILSLFEKTNGLKK